MHLLAKSDAVSVKIVKAAFPFLSFLSFRLVSPLVVAVVVYCVFFVVFAVLSQWKITKRKCAYKAGVPKEFFRFSDCFWEERVLRSGASDKPTNPKIKSFCKARQTFCGNWESVWAKESHYESGPKSRWSIEWRHLSANGAW